MYKIKKIKNNAKLKLSITAPFLAGMQPEVLNKIDGCFSFRSKASFPAGIFSMYKGNNTIKKD